MQSLAKNEIRTLATRARGGLLDELAELCAEFLAKHRISRAAEIAARVVNEVAKAWGGQKLFFPRAWPPALSAEHKNVLAWLAAGRQPADIARDLNQTKAKVLVTRHRALLLNDFARFTATAVKEIEGRDDNASDQIGQELAEVVATRLKNSSVYIPRPQQSNAARDEEIYQRFNNNAAELALQYRVSLARIYQIVHERRDFHIQQNREQAHSAPASRWQTTVVSQ